MSPTSMVTLVKILTVAGFVVMPLCLVLTLLTLVFRKRLLQEASLPWRLLISLTALIAIQALISVPIYCFYYYFHQQPSSGWSHVQLGLGYVSEFVTLITWIVLFRRRLLLRYAAITALLSVNLLTSAVLEATTYLGAQKFMASHTAYFYYFYSYWAGFALQTILWLVITVYAARLLFKPNHPSIPEPQPVT